MSFELEEGEILGLIGPNGSGKSTTFNLIAGALAAKLGPSCSRARWRRAREPRGHHGIARTFQIPRPFRKLSLLDNVALAAYYGQDRAVSRSHCSGSREALAMVGLPADAHAAIDGLGAAALKKLELARALATQPRLLLADESLDGLDEHEMEQAADMLAASVRRRASPSSGSSTSWAC